MKQHPYLNKSPIKPPSLEIGGESWSLGHCSFITFTYILISPLKLNATNNLAAEASDWGSGLKCSLLTDGREIIKRRNPNKKHLFISWGLYDKWI